MGGRCQLGEVSVRLWIEHAHQTLIGADGRARGDVIRTFQTEEQFFAVLASGPEARAEEKAVAARLADLATGMLERGEALGAVVETLLGTLPDGQHVPFAALQVLEGCRADLAESDAPPLFLTRGGHLVLLPVVEDVSHGRLVRQCQFRLQEGDYLAMVSEGYIRARGWSRRWGWRDIAVSVRRWTDTGCDAGQLLGALVRMYHRLAGEDARPDSADVSIIAMHARPMRAITVWTGPPVDPAHDRIALEKLMVEPGTRVICGDTTARIAARLLEVDLVMEPRPKDGWAEVPPTSRLEGVDLVTEGLVTMARARERMKRVERARDRLTARSWPGLLPGEDGATRLARVLLAADKIHFVVGLAVNPAQVADAARTVPLRQVVVEELIQDLRSYGKLVSVEYL